MGARETGGSSNRSSPSSDSQDGLADTEHDAGGRDQGNQIAEAAPPKKKRTRTLTTPHQSAVLHALLAQSRFPTTAMREEVGRAIGLSARKVQIWFQNQRQKARRPRSQSDAPPNLLPHQDPNTNAPPPGPSYPARTTTPQGHIGGGSHQAANTHVQASGSLLGPGVPGHIISPSRPSLSRPPESQILPLAEPPPLTHRSVLDNPYPQGRPTPLPPHARTFGDRPPVEPLSRSFSRVLPPLSIVPPPNFHQTPSAGSNILPPLTQSAPPTAVSYELRPSSPEPTISPTRVVQPIPPPFTLQPPPQWDTSSMSPRPNTSSWSSRSSGDNFPMPFLPSRRPRPVSRPESRSDSNRPGRYDPVRDNLP
ncbi:hypothetical protein ONZ45_g5003 [Pleurotus djamor]|nr:hypothetical protein ONZ45_g5003 [Pleurotus djamor]